MSDFNNIITEKNILKYGKKSRREFKPVQGNCGKIVDRFEGYMIDECGLSYKDKSVTEKYGVKHIRVGPNGEEKHFVFYIDGKFIQNYNSNQTIIIDLSFDQFNNMNKNQGCVSISYGKKKNLDKIRIMKPKDNRLDEQYRSVSEFLI